MNINENVTKGNMNSIMEQKKKEIQSIIVYNGITDNYGSNSSLGGTLLNGGDNFSTDNYTDLRQAYTETLIPVTHEDYERIPKYNNLNEYKFHRDTVDTTPLTKEEAERKLLKQQSELEQQSAALAFKYAQEAEKVKQKKALKILSDHIREISKNIKNDEFKLNRVKMDQTALLKEIQNIRDEIEYVLRTRGNSNYISSDEEYKYESDY